MDREVDGTSEMVGLFEKDGVLDGVLDGLTEGIASSSIDASKKPSSS